MEVVVRLQAQSFSLRKNDLIRIQVGERSFKTLWLSRHSGIGKPKKGRLEAALKVGLGNFSRDRCSEIDATAGIEEVEVVERRPYVLQLSIRRDGRIAGHEIDLRRQVLVDRVEMHLGRIDGLIESERP